MDPEPPPLGDSEAVTTTSTSAPTATAMVASPVGPTFDKPRWTAESKVYTRKNSHSKNPKPPPPPPKPNPNPNSPPQDPTPAEAPPYDPSARPTAAPSDGASSSRVAVIAPVPNGHAAAAEAPDAVEIGKLNSKSKEQLRQERRDFHRNLACELDQVRALSIRLEATAAALLAPTPTPKPVTRAPTPRVVTTPTPKPIVIDADAGYANSQLSVTNPETLVPIVASGVALLPFRRQLTISVVPVESVEKEKRTPKANQYYKNDEFLLAKDKFPPADSHGHKKSSKSNHHKKRHSLAVDAANFTAERRMYAHAFKRCHSLIMTLLKHPYGWVFKVPVDPVKLNLPDYFNVIKKPMDLGTIKARLSRGQYRSPREFAEDVRLTFGNAMLYNPKPQDVHLMAEQLLHIFEAEWSPIEEEVALLAAYPPPPKKVLPPPPIDLRLLQRPDSMMHHAVMDLPPRTVYTPHTPRTPAMKKPKAKDLYKREMTLDEKRKLSNNLQNLPPEKLDVIVQIIKNKNLALSQHDDEIEVDIDSMDTETLWELDRFVTNYKKNLSKHKRKAERAMLARLVAERNGTQHVLQETVMQTREPIVVDVPRENVVANKSVAPPMETQDENKGENMSRSSNTSSSSGGSGSSSSDSDSESSSSDGSDAAHSS